MPVLLDIFLTFCKIGAFTIGGGWAMIPLIERDVLKKKWATEDEFTDILALAQSAPGLLAVNIAIFVGHKVAGTKGSIVATLGSILPSFFIILAIAMVFTDFKDNIYVEKIFKGIRPVVVALIFIPMAKMAIKSNKSWWAWTLTAASLALVAFFKVSPVYILLTVLLVSLVIAHIKSEATAKSKSEVTEKSKSEATAKKSNSEINTKKEDEK